MFTCLSQVDQHNMLGLFTSLSGMDGQGVANAVLSFSGQSCYGSKLSVQRVTNVGPYVASFQRKRTHAECAISIVYVHCFKRHTSQHLCIHCMLQCLLSESLATFNVIWSVAEQKLLMCSAFVCEHLFAITESLFTSQPRLLSTGSDQQICICQACGMCLLTCQHGCDLPGRSKHAQTQVHLLLP